MEDVTLVFSTGCANATAQVTFPSSEEPCINERGGRNHFSRRRVHMNTGIIEAHTRTSHADVGRTSSQWQKKEEGKKKSQQQSCLDQNFAAPGLGGTVPRRSPHSVMSSSVHFIFLDGQMWRKRRKAEKQRTNQSDSRIQICRSERTAHWRRHRLN